MQRQWLTVDRQPAHQSVTRETPRPAVDGASVPKPAAASETPKAETPRMSSAAPATKPAAAAAPQKPGSAYPAQHTSTIDVNANPVHPTTGKPLLSTDLDEDFPEDDKPWRRPGSVISDYFNYGFDEFTWASYCLKQQDVRKEVADQKKELEDIQAFMGMPGGGMPGMPGGPPPPGGTPGAGAGATPGAPPAPPHSAGPPPAMPTMPGMPEMSQDMMQAMFTGMMSQGLDPSAMDPMTFMQHAQAMMGGAQPGGGGGGGGAPTQGGQPGFGGQPPQGYGGQMGYGGYDQRGGFGSGGRGKGMRRW